MTPASAQDGLAPGDDAEPKVGARCLAALRRAEAAEECTGVAPETSRPPPSRASLCPELDIDMLEQEMLAIMATNNELEETLTLTQKPKPDAKAVEQAKLPEAWGALPPAASSSEEEPTCRLVADLEARLQAAEAESDRIKEDYAGKFRKAEQDYTEKFRQVKEVCLQLAAQINFTEERAAEAELSETRARGDCEDLRGRLAAAEAAAAEALTAAAASPTSPPATSSSEAGAAQQIAELQKRLGRESEASTKLLQHLQRRQEKSDKEAVNWRKMVIEEQQRNSELQADLQKARQAEMDARRAEREAKKMAPAGSPPRSAASLSGSFAGDAVSNSSPRAADAACRKLREQLEQARATSRDSLDAAEEWKRRHDRMCDENEELRTELATAQIARAKVGFEQHHVDVRLRTSPGESVRLQRPA